MSFLIAVRLFSTFSTLAVKPLTWSSVPPLEDPFPIFLERPSNMEKRFFISFEFLSVLVADASTVVSNFFRSSMVAIFVICLLIESMESLMDWRLSAFRSLYQKLLYHRQYAYFRIFCCNSSTPGNFSNISLILFMSLVLIWGPDCLATGADVVTVPLFKGSDSRLPSSSLREEISLSKTSQSSLFLISVSKSLMRLRRSSSSD